MQKKSLKKLYIYSAILNFWVLGIWLSQRFIIENWHFLARYKMPLSSLFSNFKALFLSLVRNSFKLASSSTKLARWWDYKCWIVDFALQFFTFCYGHPEMMSAHCIVISVNYDLATHWWTLCLLRNFGCNWTDFGRILFDLDELKMIYRSHICLHLLLTYTLKSLII